VTGAGAVEVGFYYFYGKVIGAGKTYQGKEDELPGIF
jgi:hypothetical protein